MNKNIFWIAPLVVLGVGLLPMPFNTTDIENLYCVGDSCFPGQGLNAVAFSGFACAHKIGSKLNINDFKLPD